MYLMKFISISFLLISSLLLGKCQSQKVKPTDQSNLVTLDDVHYNIHDADHVMVLARELVEVSGLAYNIKESTLMVVNDELGYIYEIDKDNGSILTKKKFANFGDYEGIEFMNDDLIVCRSNGFIYMYDQEHEDTYKMIQLSVTSKNNIEGITYDADNNQILLACKGVPTVPDLIENTKGKLVCIYDIESENLLEEPFILIKDKHLKKSVDKIYDGLGLTDNQLEKLKKRVEGFAPSGLAIHPINGELYILSAQKSLIVVVDKEREIKHIHFLDQDLHVQPEGICFTPSGDMYVSNEGKSGSAKIYLYTYQQ